MLSLDTILLRRRQTKKQQEEAATRFREVEAELQPPSVTGPPVAAPPVPQAPAAPLTPRALLSQVEQLLQPDQQPPTLKERLTPDVQTRNVPGKPPAAKTGPEQFQEFVSDVASVPKALTRGLPVAAENVRAREARQEIAQRIPGAGGEERGWQAKVVSGVERGAELVQKSPPARALAYPFEKSLEIAGRELEPLRQLTLALATPGLTPEEKQAVLKAVSETRSVGWLTSKKGKARLAEAELLTPETKLQKLLNNLGNVALQEGLMITDPVNLVPILGFTHIDDLARAAKTIGGVTKNPTVRKLTEAIIEGIARGERGAVGKAGEEAGDLAEAGRVARPAGEMRATPEDLAVERVENDIRAKYRKGVATIRDIEARTTPIPPEARAAMRPTAPGGPEHPERLLNFQETEAIRGGRYETNWVTKLSDLLSGAIPALRGPLARTPADKAARAAMTAHDWYILTQGAKAENRVWEWMERAKGPLGLDLRTGRLKNVRLKPEFANDAPWFKELEGYVNHVTEFPEKYDLTPEQLALVKELQGGGRAPFGEILTLEQRAGIDISEVADYFPRFAKETPPGYKISEGRGTRLGTRPSHAKHRVFGDVEARYEAGFRDDPILALFHRAQAGIEGIANAETVKLIKAMGLKPSDVLQATHAGDVQAAKDAREAYKAARAAAVRKGAGVEEKMAVEIADAHLEDSVRALKHAAAQVREKGPRLFGRIVSYEVRDAFAKYTKNLSEGFVDDVFTVMRGTAISGDLSASLIQNWYTFYRNPPAWGLAMAEGVHGLYGEPLGYLARNYESIMRGLDVAAMRAPTEFLLHQGGGMSRWLNRVPGVRQTQRAFEWEVFVAQSERWKAVERLAKTPDEMMEMAAVLRKQSGILIMPGMTATQVKAAARLAFAPQFMGAIHSAVFDIFRGGAAGREAMKSVSMAFGGAASLTVAINLKLNGELPNMTDPDKPGFWGIKVGDGYVFPFGPYQPAIVAFTRTGRAIDDARQGKMPSSRDLQAIPRLLESKAAIPARTLVAIGDALGMPFDKLRGEPFENLRLRTPGDWANFFGKYLPIGLSQARTGIDRGFPAALLEIIGGRTTPMPTWGGIDLQVQELGFVDSAGKPIEHWRDLTEPQKLEAEQDTRIKALLTRAEGDDDTSKLYATLEEDRVEGLGWALVELRQAGLNHEALVAYNGAVEQIKGFQGNAFRTLDMTGLLADASKTTNPDLALYRDFQAYTSGAAGPGGTWSGEIWGQLADGCRKLVGEEDWKNIIVPQMMVDRNPQVQQLQTWAIEVGDTGYYDVRKKDGTADTQARERMRLRDPELDAKLFLLGGPTRVMTPQAKALVEKWYEALLAGVSTQGR